MATEAEIAWAAGIFEGEGSMTPISKTAVKLSMEMTDLDVLERFQEIVGGGTISGKIIALMQPQWRPRWQWYIQRGTEAERVIRLLMPWFQSRRRAKAEEMLVRLQDNPGSHATKTHCVNGHLLSDDNVYRWARHPGRRICRECHRVRARERYYRLKVAS